MVLRCRGVGVWQGAHTSQHDAKAQALCSCTDDASQTLPPALRSIPASALWPHQHLIWIFFYFWFKPLFFVLV